MQPRIDPERIAEEIRRALQEYHNITPTIKIQRMKIKGIKKIEIIINGQHTLTILAFQGRPPHYRPWIEFTNINPRQYPQIEDTILDIIAQNTPPATPLYIEYLWDKTTLKELETGTHPALTRLGAKLLIRGYTWFKDWYYPEGWLEGTQKLQAEKPQTPQQAKQHLKTIKQHAEKTSNPRAQGIKLLLQHTP